MLKDRFILFTITLAIISLQIAFWSIWFRLEQLPREVAFWYTLPPADRLAPAHYLWLIPGLAAGFFIFNAILAFFLYRKYPAAAQTLAACSTLLCLIAAIAVVKIVLIYSTLL